MNGGAYLVLLFLGAVVVVADGQLLLRTGPAYLSEVYQLRPARKLSLLVSVLFHLVMLGLVAVVASIDLGPDPGIPDVVRRLGVILLLTAVGHVLAIVVLSRLRHEQQETELVEEQLHHHDRAGRPDAPGSPPRPGSAGAGPAGAGPADAGRAGGPGPVG